jgi:CheY-like chemotaxis protein/sRNA-binding carbon storage regulator CsrA
MLVLSRKPGERAVIPDCCVTVTVLGVTCNRVWLGVSAPPTMAVPHREVGASSSLDDTRHGSLVTRENWVTSVRVLIADPDEYLVHSYRQHMERRGIEVICATSGLECIEKLRESVPDVLVLEPSLPWGWGDGVLAMMHEEPNIPRVPVIILTDALDRSVLYRMAPFRVDDFQPKPLSGRRLTERILALTRRRPMETCHEKSDQ